MKYIAQVAAERRPAGRGQLRQRDRPKEKYDAHDSITPMIESAVEHCELLDSLGFTRYNVSLKDSDPQKVIDVNRRFAEKRPDVPLHLGVTEAGLPPDGVIKTRIAFEQLISRGIGDTIRVSLTVPNPRKIEEIAAGRQIPADIAGSRTRGHHGLPASTSPAELPRVENHLSTWPSRENDEVRQDYALTMPAAAA